MAPILAAVVVVRLCVGVIPRPEDNAGWAVWLFFAMGLSVVTIGIVGRFALRFLPLVAWLRMSLIFPGETPSRMRLAMREGTARDLQRRIMAGESLGESADEAAQNLLLLMRRLNAHDRLTRGHCERVRAYSDLIAAEMDLPTHERAKLHWAALAHDVGKLHLPRSLLAKTGHPSSKEWELIRKHPALADHLVAPLRSWLGDWVEAATQHHERHDGGGYPNGLKGERIHISARIVAVADAFDTMTSVRSYQKPLSFADAHAELARNAGTQFDPDVVRAFLEVGPHRLRVVAGQLAWRSSLAAGTGITTILTSTDKAMATGVTSLASAAIVLTSALGVTGSAPTDGPATPDVVVARLVADRETPAPIEDGEPLTQPASTTNPPVVSVDSGEPVPTSTGAASSTTTTTIESSSTTSAPPSSTISPPATSTSVPSTTTTGPAPPTTTTSSTTTTTTLPPPGSSWADNDTYSGAKNILHALWVLDNDSPPAGFEYHTLTIVIPPDNGTATVIVPNGNPSQAHINYRTSPGYIGVDTFTYEICDIAGDCAIAEVTFDSQ